MFRRTAAVAAIVAALSTPWSTARTQSPVSTSGWLGRYYDGFASGHVDVDFWLQILSVLDDRAPIYSARRPKLDSHALPAEIVGSMQPPPVQWTSDKHDGTAASSPCGGSGCASNTMSGSFKFSKSAPPARLPATVPAPEIGEPEPTAIPSTPKSVAAANSPQQTVDVPETTRGPGVTQTDGGEVASGSNAVGLDPADMIMPGACDAGCTDFFAPVPIPLVTAPEPTTFVLLATGIALVGATARRFRIRTATSTTPR